MRPLPPKAWVLVILVAFLLPFATYRNFFPLMRMGMFSEPINVSDETYSLHIQDTKLDAPKIIEGLEISVYPYIAQQLWITKDEQNLYQKSYLDSVKKVLRTQYPEARQLTVSKKAKGYDSCAIINLR